MGPQSLTLTMKLTFITTGVYHIYGDQKSDVDVELEKYLRENMTQAKCFLNRTKKRVEIESDCWKTDEIAKLLIEFEHWKEVNYCNYHGNYEPCDDCIMCDFDSDHHP